MENKTLKKIGKKAKTLASHLILSVLPIILGCVPAFVIYKINEKVHEARNLGHNISGFDADFKFGYDNNPMEVGSEHEVKGCKVIDGYRFELYLSNGNKINAHLTKATKEDAVKEVSELLKLIKSPPTIVLLSNTGDYWIVDFKVVLEGRKTSLIDLLSSKGLVL